MAFSCYGFVRSLNSDPEKGITVEARSIPKNKNDKIFYEDTQTDLNGHFRLRGIYFCFISYIFFISILLQFLHFYSIST